MKEQRISLSPKSQGLQGLSKEGERVDFSPEILGTQTVVTFEAHAAKLTNGHEEACRCEKCRTYA